MFTAIGKLFRTIGYLLTGRINRISSVWAKNTDVISAQYDEVVKEKRASLTKYKDAVGSLIGYQEKKSQQAKAVTQECSDLEKLRAGALAKAKSIAAKFGENKELVKSDPEYIKCQAAYKDFSSTLLAKQATLAELEESLKGFDDKIQQHKVAIQSLMRDLEKIQNQKHETIADIVSAEEEKKIADLLSGVGEDNTSNTLRELEEVRNKAKADAKISRELAGLDTKKAEADFVKYAENSAAEDEFDKLIGLTKETKDPVSVEPSIIPEK